MFGDVNFDEFGLALPNRANLSHGFKLFLVVLDLIWHVSYNNNYFFLFVQELLIEFGGIPDIKGVKEPFSEGNDEALDEAIRFMECAEGNSFKILDVKLILVEKFLLG